MAFYNVLRRNSLIVVLIALVALSSCKPQAVIIVDAESGNAPFVVNFDASQSTDKGKDIKEYSWDFDDDGNFDARGIKIGHTFSDPGVYTVRLRVTDSKGKTSDATKTISVYEIPLKAVISAPLSACSSSNVTFDASSSTGLDNGITGYEWDFDGDGIVDASGVNAGFSFTEEKTYSVRLTVHDLKGGSSDAVHEIRIYGNPSAEFTADENTIVYPFAATLRWHTDNATDISITDNNTGDKVYEGAVADGYVSVEPYTTTTYTLTASGPCGAISRNLTVFVCPSHNHAVIAASVNSGCIPLDVDFDASGSFDVENDITNYEWDLDGDGTYDATGMNVSHTYPVRGEYHVGLKITDSKNNISESTLIITAHGRPQADIKSDSLLIGADGNVTLKWTTIDATSVSIDNGIGSVSANGTVTLQQIGTKTYTLTATGPCGSTTDTITIMPDTPISVTIESPEQGENIRNTEVLVKGSINNPLGGETMITVNGYPAFLYDNCFTVSGVELASGNNTITVEAIGEFGNKGKTSLTVNSTVSEKLISISCNDATGISPMETSLKITVPQGFIPVMLGIHPAGGSINVLEQTSDNQYHVRLTGEGIYTFIARMTDIEGMEYADSISIVIQDKQKIDTLLRNKWDEMKEALRNEDIEGALINFNDHSSEEYEEIFTSIIDKLPQMANEMSDLELVSIKGGLAKYVLKRNEVINGRQYEIAYFVYFSPDPFGIWSIDEF